MADWNVCLNLVSKASISLLNDKRYGSSVKGKIKGKSFSRLPFSFAWFLEMDCLLINSSNSSSVILPCLLSTTRDFSCSSDASFTIKIDWMFVSSRTRYALHNTVVIKWQQQQQQQQQQPVIYFPDILYLTIIPRVCVGHELATIISYQTSASGIIVSLKTPTKYREFFHTLFVKTTDFQLGLILSRSVQLPYLESMA